MKVSTLYISDHVFIAWRTIGRANTCYQLYTGSYCGIYILIEERAINLEEQRQFR